jgi:glycogen debranching enzyme
MEFSKSLVGSQRILKSLDDLDSALQQFDQKYFQPLKLYEYLVLDVEKSMDVFFSAWEARKTREIPPSLLDLRFKSRADAVDLIEARIVCDLKTFKRFSKVVNVEEAVVVMAALWIDGTLDGEGQRNDFKRILNDINLKYYKEYDSDKATIFTELRNRAKFLRLDEHGPRLGPIDGTCPIVDTYFTRLPRNEVTASLHSDQLMLANNGWIWNADPLVNFASSQSKAYYLRQVISWGDCVKLRYGDKPADNPWLWNHMASYSIQMAKLFHGFRIDNCHSTPIHVASHFLDLARKQRPNLYVFAELFTGSEQKDILFVSQLGINSLIREAMNAWDASELSRLVHRMGGASVGSFSIQSDKLPLEILGHKTGSDYHEIECEGELIVNITKSIPHALFMDCTHDNETPHQKRTAEDSLSNAVLVAMADCAIGSVNGYDILNPVLLDVVKETRKYRNSSLSTGIIPVKQLFGPLHKKMALEGYSEIHVHQEQDYISVHRVHPVTHDGYLAICRTAFKGQKSNSGICD